MGGGEEGSAQEGYGEVLWDDQAVFVVRRLHDGLLEVSDGEESRHGGGVGDGEFFGVVSYVLCLLYSQGV